jgi:repressor of nif and glnA expression
MSIPSGILDFQEGYLNSLNLNNSLLIILDSVIKAKFFVSDRYFQEFEYKKEYGIFEEEISGMILISTNSDKILRLELISPNKKCACLVSNTYTIVGCFKLSTQISPLKVLLIMGKTFSEI